MIFVTNTGINEYYKNIEKKEKFKEIQEATFSVFVNYALYGAKGVMYYLSPSTNQIFVRNTVIPPDITAHIDSIQVLDIDSNMKGKALIVNSFFGPLDFSLVLLLIMTFLAQFYGYDSFHTPGYIKFLSSVGSFRQTVFSLLASRFLLFVAGFVVLCSGVLVLCLIRGVVFTTEDIKGLWAIFGAGVVMLLFFFALGSILGAFLKNDIKVLTFILTWILMVVISLFFFVSLNQSRFQDTLEDFKTSLFKWEVSIEFEEKVKTMNKKAKEKASEFMEETYKKIKAAEKKQRDRIQKSINSINRLAILHPTIFFWHTCNESSSCGYSNFMRFYDYAQHEQEAFTRFWINRVYFHDPKVLVPFRKSAEYIFQAKSQIPSYYWLALILSIFYSVILFTIAYIRLRRICYPGTKQSGAFTGLTINMKKGKKYTIRSFFSEVSLQFLNSFFGNPRVRDWQISIDGKNLINQEIKDFIYLPNPQQFPDDIRPVDIIKLVKRSTMKRSEPEFPFPDEIDKKILNRPLHSCPRIKQNLFFLYLAQWLDTPIVIFHDFITAISAEDSGNFADIVDRMAERGTTVIELVSNETTFIIHDELFYIHKEKDKYVRVPRSYQDDQ